MHERHACGNGQGRVRHAANDIKLGVAQATPHGLGHSVEDVWVGDDDAEVHIYGRYKTALELELAELDCLRWGAKRFLREVTSRGNRCSYNDKLA